MSDQSGILVPVLAQKVAEAKVSEVGQGMDLGSDAGGRGEVGDYFDGVFLESVHAVTSPETLLAFLASVEIPAEV